MKKKENKSFLDILIRYFILLVAALPDFGIFYFVFTPLTIYAVYFILSMFFNVSLMKDVILISGRFPIQIIGACVAGSAYYLLLILNLSTPGIKFVKRMKMISFSFLVFLVFNILRIVLLSSIFVNGSPAFDIVHLASWYFGSVILVVLIWFAEVKFFKIKEIPFYSDVKKMFGQFKK